MSGRHGGGVEDGLTVTGAVHFARCGRGGRAELRAAPAVAPGRVPRAARLMALAVRLDGLVRSGAVRDHAELARLGRVTRARVSQVTALVHLAPDVREAVLFLPPVTGGRDRLALRHLLPLALTPDWEVQRRMWRALAAERGLPKGETECEHG